MRAKAKYAVIYRHRKEYPIVVMCKFFSVSRSGYYSFVKRMNRPEKDAALAETIRQQQAKCFHTYGYRRMWQWLKGSKEIYHCWRREIATIFCREYLTNFCRKSRSQQNK